MRLADYGTFWGDRPTIRQLLDMFRTGTYDSTSPGRLKVSATRWPGVGICSRLVGSHSGSRRTSKHAKRTSERIALFHSEVGLDQHVQSGLLLPVRQHDRTLLAPTIQSADPLFVQQDHRVIVRFTKHQPFPTWPEPRCP